MVFDKIKELIVAELKVPAENIKLESRITEDLGADSMDGITLVMGLEDEFDIAISDDEATALKTVEDLVNLITSKQK